MFTPRALRILPRALPRAAPTAAPRLAPTLRFASSGAKSDGKKAKEEIAAIPKKAMDKAGESLSNAKEQLGALGQVNMPNTTEVIIDEDLKIPTMPDSYQHPEPAEDLPPPSSSNQKVHLVADASTHLEGGPRTGTGADDVQHGEAGDVMYYKEGEQSKPLSADERQGLLVLAGIVFGGYLLSVITTPRSHAVAREVVETHNKPHAEHK